MKQLIIKMKMVLMNNKGETLMEGIVSLLIFTILMATVGTMIVTSLRITALSTKEATERQDNINKAIMENYPTAPSTVKLAFTGTGIDVAMNVELSDADGYIAFTPPEE